MVRFEDGKYIIVVEVGSGSPIEDWQNTIDELLEVLSYLNTDMISGRNFYHVLGLIRDMMPDWDDAKRMYIEPPKETA